MIEGTFTGFLASLSEFGIDLAIRHHQDSVSLTASRDGKFATCHLAKTAITQAKEDIASVELGEIMNAVLR